ncbi:MAG TPA: YafY family protein [Cyclobacteriaceae bacterium]|nr:YafY family protein [Cyclobacteriaceae bacterium]
MKRVTRLLGILTYLQSHKFTMAEKLSDRFAVSVRTVYRDIRSLEEIGIPVSFENNRGYFIVQGYFLPPVSFTLGEANALVVMAALATRFGDNSIAKESDSALEKIRAILRQADKEKSEYLVNRIKVLKPAQDANRHLHELQYAIAEKLILRIDYTDAQKRKTTREIEPIGLIYYTEQWHSIAWCWKRRDYRDFKINQIESLLNTHARFRRKKHISIEDHLRTWKTTPQAAE